MSGPAVSDLPSAMRYCYRRAMLKTRMKRRAAETQRRLARLAEVESSVTALADEDLLDLADIFSADATTPIGAMASAEMTKRNLSL